jgi:hypothetical protein
MGPERNNRTVSLKIQGQTPEEILALERRIDEVLPGCKMTTGIKANEYPAAQRTGRFNYDYYAYVLVSFELGVSPSGQPVARPTQRNAVLAFKEEQAL